MASLQPDPQPPSSAPNAVNNLTRKLLADDEEEEDHATATQAGSSSNNSSKKPKLDLEELDEFPVESENPFRSRFCGSDVVLRVEEDRLLHCHKGYLSLYSPYFRQLLDSTKGWAEAGTHEVKLKSSQDVKITYDIMVKFLMQLYPVHSFRPITDDQTLSDLFPLAEYFQCQHVRTKCEAYVRQQLETQGKQLPITSTLLYMHLCEQFRADEFLPELLDLVSRKTSTEIKGAEKFQWLSSDLQNQVLQKRFQYAEATIVELKAACRSAFRYSPEDIDSGRDCASCDARVCKAYIVCKPCKDTLTKKLDDAN